MKARNCHTECINDGQYEELSAHLYNHIDEKGGSDMIGPLVQ